MTAITSQQIESLMQQAQRLHRGGQVSRASELYGQVLRCRPRDFQALHLAGLAAVQSNCPERALELIDRALQINRQHAATYYVFGCAQRLLGRHDAAVDSFERALNLKPDYFDARYHRAISLTRLERWNEALEEYDAAIALRADYAEAYYNRGIAQRRLGRLDDALASYDSALRLKPAYAEALNNRGTLLRHLRRFDEALTSFEASLAAAPHSVEAAINRGVVQIDLKRYAMALDSFAAVIAVNPLQPHAYNNQGIAYFELKRYAEAVCSFDQAIALQSDYAEAYLNRGNTWRQERRYEAAVIDFKKALQLKPDMHFLPGLCLHAKMQVCDWSDFETELASLGMGIELGKAVTPPFPMLAMTTSAALHRKAAATWAREKCDCAAKMPPVRRRRRPGKIRLAYFSADFREHAVSILIAELLELHDRSAFEVSAFSWGTGRVDAMRQRIEEAVDHFVDVSMATDHEIALLARSRSIDIAVDLGGYTENSRPNIFALRAAPIQVSYLGYLGTSGAPHMDYIIADETILPAGLREHYTESVIFLPCYQVNDSRRRVAEQVFSRAELGIPAGSFVFYSMNANYKITPATFGGWMRILKRVPAAILYLFAGSSLAESNLRQEAAARGVDPARLIFGGWLAAPEYLARGRIADLFLDTLPYNAGTTASDALWTGVPVLTCLGDSFAGRQAASLLRAVLLPELITGSAAEYEDTAVALALDRPRLAGIRRQLAANRRRSLLFDGPAFARCIDTAYLAIQRRHRSGKAPQDVRSPFCDESFSRSSS